MLYHLSCGPTPSFVVFEPVLGDELDLHLVTDSLGAVTSVLLVPEALLLGNVGMLVAALLLLAVLAGIVLPTTSRLSTA